MHPVAKVVSDLFMLVLSVLAAPSDQTEFRLDLIMNAGARVDTYVVRRAETGFVLLQQQGDKLVEKGTIRPVAGKPATFALKMGEIPEQVFDFAAGIPGFSMERLQKEQTLDLKASDGAMIYVRRSGAAVYLTPGNGRITFACHRD